MESRRTNSPLSQMIFPGRLLHGALICLMALALAACTERDDLDDGLTADTAGVLGEDTTEMAPGETALRDTIDVGLVSYEIDMPETLEPGRTVFEARNEADIEHGFEIEGQGIEEVVETIAPGDSATLEVDLRPGTYVAYCPVGDHRERGMEMTVTVDGDDTMAGGY